MHWLDPDYLPEISSVFEQFLVNPNGEVDGMMLSDGTEVHFPPHMGDEVCASIRAGEKPRVKVRGVRPRAGDVVAAVAIETIEGKRITDNGPPDDKKARKAAHEQKRTVSKQCEVEGVVRRLLHGPKGETRGVLLDDGRSGRFPAHEAAQPLQILRTGSPVILRGDEIVTEHGVVLALHEIGTSRDGMHSFNRKPKAEKHAPQGEAEVNSVPAA